jgi:hypothetical protein
MKASLVEDEDFETQDEHGRSLLAIDNSYIIALDSSVEQMGKM